MNQSGNQSVGVFQTKQSKYSEETGGQFILSQNYPNPFNDKTTIGFFLMESSKVLLDVYDVLGRKVVQLLDGQMCAGIHQVEWWRQSAIARLPAGNYTYELNVENSKGVYKQVKTMIVQ